MEIHVIRHTPVNFDKNRCYGQLDIPLAEGFIENAKSLSNQLSDCYEQVITSPLSRCVKLADELNLKDSKRDNRLLELDFGDWEGQLWNDINQKALNTWMEDFVNNSPTNGETLNQMYKRIAEFIDSLRSENFDKVLIITHSGVIRCFWAYFLEIPLYNIFKLPISFGEVFKFNLGDNKQYDSVKQLK
ncbi:MAG: alpha-ribazole phosphatase [Ekhidna sp.]|nr:alpha-ribazole phosphatase [Ekhidna sp.]